MGKKVLHVITGLGDGGAEGVLTRLCLNSHAAEHVVVSLTDEGKYAPILRENGVKVVVLGMTPGMLSIRTFFSLAQLIWSERPDVVQTWMYHADLFAGVAARLVGIKDVYWGIRHSSLEPGTAKKGTILVARFCALLSYVLPKKILCCANKAKEAHADLGYCDRKMIVIPNGYDMSRFFPDQEARLRTRKELGVAQDGLLLGMLGRFHRQKHHRNLLEALSLLIESGYPVQCVLAGREMTRENESLSVWVSDLGLDKSVFLLGSRTDVPELMNSIDVHVLSSQSGEGFPNVVAEAMACGVPCVSTDVGDASLIIGELGAVCPPADPERLAKGIMILLDEKGCAPERWQERREQCRERIKNLYSIEQTVDMFEEVWNLQG